MTAAHLQTCILLSAKGAGASAIMIPTSASLASPDVLAALNCIPIAHSSPSFCIHALTLLLLNPFLSLPVRNKSDSSLYVP